jgi:hypothetical protein
MCSSGWHPSSSSGAFEPLCGKLAQKTLNWRRNRLIPPVGSPAFTPLEPIPVEWSKILEIRGFGTISCADRISRNCI